MTLAPVPAGRRSRLSVCAALVVLTLTGCGMLHPGAAAVVGSQTIPHEQVDDVARALCAANASTAASSGRSAPDVPARSARQGALQILVETAVSQQFGEARGVEPDPQMLSEAMARNETGLRLLPEDLQAVFAEALREYTEGQLVLIEIGRQSLQEQARRSISDNEALAEGQRLRQQFAKDLEIEVDPRYGEYRDMSLQPGASSLSVAASDRARAGEKPQPSPTWVAELPAVLKCH